MKMKKLQFTAVYKKTGQWISAWVEEVPGVNTQGRTKKEAQANLREALVLMLKTARQLNHKKRTLNRESLTISLPV